VNVKISNDFNIDESSGSEMKKENGKEGKVQTALC
jgi:hypothetical protein